MTRQNFISWLLNRGYVLVTGTANVYEKNGIRYEARAKSLGKRTQYSVNRWSSMQTTLYSKRYINRDGKLDYIVNAAR